MGSRESTAQTRPSLDPARLGRGDFVAVAGAIAVLIAVVFLPWYGVGSGKLAPVSIDASLLAANQDQPGVPPSVGAPNQADPFGGDTAQPEQFVPAPPRAPSVPDQLGAWKQAGALGIAMNGILIVTALIALGFVAAAGYGERPATRDALLLATLGLAGVAAVIVRMVQRPDEIAHYSFNATLEVGIYVALIGAIAIALSALASLGGQRPIPVFAGAEGAPRPPSLR
ncbi:MAG: hypothetical protein QOJ38_532 [Solirubrobacterales bacterium]|nr:hypothetical protein [Solirubrobacterales bacterium]